MATTTVEIHESYSFASEISTHFTETNQKSKDGLVENEDVLHTIYLVFLFITTIAGNFGNILVIGAVMSDKRLWKEGNIFIVNLAVADLCVTGFVDPFSLAGVFIGHEWFLQQTILCHVIGSVCLVSCVCSLWSIAAISLNRYILLCRQHLYKEIYTWKNTIIICIALWLGAFCLDLPNFLNWGDHTYDMKTMACSYDRLASYSYTVFFITMFVTAPLFIVLFCNVNIYITVVRSKMRVSSHAGGYHSSSSRDEGTPTVYTIMDDEQTFGNSESNPVKGLNTTKDVTSLLNVPKSNATRISQLKLKKSKVRKSRELRNDIKLAKTLFIVFIAFCLCWAPYALICLIDRHDEIHKAWYAFSVLLAHASSTLNSILYAVTNRGFRDGYKTFLRIMCCCVMKKYNSGKGGSKP